MVYTPREDSKLLREKISELNLEDKKCLDIGTGSGILAFEMAKSGAKVKAIDIDSEAIEYAEKRAEQLELDSSIEFEVSDLFQEIEEDEKFDLIIFNPPYLPELDEGENDKSWNGGEKGVELTKRFLDKYKPYLKEGGQMFFILSSRSDYQEILENYSIKITETKSVGFEELYIAKFG